MPAFSSPRGRTRPCRIDTFRMTAAELGIHERTLRRWIVEHPRLRPVLRAYRYGKQWRLAVPTTWSEIETYKREVEHAVSSFHRRRKKTWQRSTIGKAFGIKFGYGNKARERDLLILRGATRLK